MYSQALWFAMQTSKPAPPTPYPQPARARRRRASRLSVRARLAAARMLAAQRA
jgi:hypothetical protein